MAAISRAAGLPEPSPNSALILWARAALEALGAPGSRWERALTFQGFSAGELCFEECFLTAQKAIEGRGGGAPSRPLSAAPTRAWRALQRRVKERTARLGSARPGHAEVVFFPVEPTHLTQQAPVAAAMGRRARVRFVTPRSAVVHALARLGHTATLTEAEWPEVTEAARAAAAAVEALQSPPGVALPAPPRGDPGELLDALRAALSATLPGAWSGVVAAQQILNDVRPRLIVVGNDLTVGGRALARAAKAAGVNTACIAHGTVLDALHAHHVADRLLVYGDAHRRHLVEHQGVEASRIEVTGAPYLDGLAGQQHTAHDLLRARLGLAPGQPFVLLAISNPANMVTLEQHERTIRAVMRLSTRLALPVVARLHRGDSPAHFERLAREVPGQRLTVVRNDEPGWPGTILEWLQGCALLLTGASTVALEAMLLDVPVISMDFTGDYSGVDFIRARATEHVTDEAGLERAAASLTGSPSAAEALRRRASGFLSDYFYKLDRGAAERCAVALDRLMRSPCAG